MCRVDASKNQIALVFSDVNLSASVRFYVRVDVFAGVWRFRADVGQFLSKQGKKPVSFRFFFFSFFFGFSLSRSSFCHDDNIRKTRKYCQAKKKKKKKHTISVSHDVSNEKGRR